MTTIRPMTYVDSSRGWHWLRVLAAALLLWAFAAGQAGAAVVVNSILVNNNSSATVTPGATITVSVTVTLTNGSRWRSTAFTTSPSSSLSTCSLAPDISVNGTWTRTFSLTAPGGSGVYDLNVAAWTNPNCNGTSSPTKTLPGGINTGPAVLSLNHVRLIHDGSALTCAPETLSLKACANAACTTLFTSNVSVTLGSTAGTWSANPVTIVNGNGTVTLSSAAAVSATLSGTVNSPASTSGLICYQGNTANSCVLKFASTSCNFDAVEPSGAPQTPIYTKVYPNAFNLDLLALTNGVLNTSSTARIIAKLVEDDGTGACSANVISNTVDITLAGTTSAGRRNVSFTPTKASKIARVQLTSGTQNACSSDNFAIRPASLAITSSGLVSDALGTNATLGTGIKAGSGLFTLKADGGNGYNGTPVIGQGMVQSSGSTAGTIAGTFGAASSASTWIATGASFQYSEVGYFRLGTYAVYDDSFADVDESKVPKECFSDTNLGSSNAVTNPNTAVGGLFGCYFGNTAVSTYFGRFIPDHFEVSDTSMINRSALTACTALPTPPDWSYLGEEITPSFSLIAVNAAGTTTQNYAGNFARLNVATSLGLGVVNDPAAGTRTLYPVCAATPAYPCMTPGTATGVFALGKAPVLAPLTIARGATALSPLLDIKAGVAPVDLDGVKIADADYDVDTVNPVASATTMNHALVANTELRYGRMGIDNAFGSELLPLSMKINAQYWNGTVFATSTTDNCTQPAFSTFVAADYKPGSTGSITGANMPFTNLSAGPVLAAGVGKLTLAKPGLPKPTTKGSVTVRSALPYLPGSARATFGVYKAGPVIYVRESY